MSNASDSDGSWEFVDKDTDSEESVVSYDTGLPDETLPADDVPVGNAWNTQDEVITDSDIEACVEEPEASEDEAKETVVEAITRMNESKHEMPPDDGAQEEILSSSGTLTVSQEEHKDEAGAVSQEESILTDIESLESEENESEPMKQSDDSKEEVKKEIVDESRCDDIIATESDRCAEATISSETPETSTSDAESLAGKLRAANIGIGDNAMRMGNTQILFPILREQDVVRRLGFLPCKPNEDDKFYDTKMRNALIMDAGRDSIDSSFEQPASPSSNEGEFGELEQEYTGTEKCAECGRIEGEAEESDSSSDEGSDAGSGDFAIIATPASPVEVVSVKTDTDADDQGVGPIAHDSRNTSEGLMTIPARTLTNPVVNTSNVIDLAVDTPINPGDTSEDTNPATATPNESRNVGQGAGTSTDAPDNSISMGPDSGSTAGTPTNVRNISRRAGRTARASTRVANRRNVAVSTDTTIYQDISEWIQTRGMITFCCVAIILAIHAGYLPKPKAVSEKVTPEQRLSECKKLSWPAFYEEKMHPLRKELEIQDSYTRDIQERLHVAEIRLLETGDYYKKALEASKSEQATIQKALESSKSEQTRIQNEYNLLKGQFAKYHEENEKLQEVNAVLERKNADLTKTIETNVNESNQLMGQTAKYREENRRLQDINARLERQNAELRNNADYDELSDPTSDPHSAIDGALGCRVTGSDSSIQKEMQSLRAVVERQKRRIMNLQQEAAQNSKSKEDSQSDGHKQESHHANVEQPKEDTPPDGADEYLIEDNDITEERTPTKQHPSDSKPKLEEESDQVAAQPNQAVRPDGSKKIFSNNCDAEETSESELKLVADNDRHMAGETPRYVEEENERLKNVISDLERENANLKKANEELSNPASHAESSAAVTNRGSEPESAMEMQLFESEVESQKENIMGLKQDATQTSDLKKVSCNPRLKRKNRGASMEQPSHGISKGGARKNRAANRFGEVTMAHQNSTMKRAPTFDIRAIRRTNRIQRKLKNKKEEVRTLKRFCAATNRSLEVTKRQKEVVKSKLAAAKAELKDLRKEKKELNKKLRIATKELEKNSSLRHCFKSAVTKHVRQLRDLHIPKPEIKDMSKKMLKSVQAIFGKIKSKFTRKGHAKRNDRDQNFRKQKSKYGYDRDEDDLTEDDDGDKIRKVHPLKHRRQFRSVSHEKHDEHKQDLEDDFAEDDDDDQIRKRHPLKHRRQLRSKNHEKRNEHNQDFEDEDVDDKMKKPHPLKHRRQQRSKIHAEGNDQNHDLEDDLDDEDDDVKMRKPHPLKHRRQQRSKNHEKRNEGRQDLEDDLDDEDDKMKKPHPLKHRRQQRSKNQAEQNDQNHDLEDDLDDEDDKMKKPHPLKHRRQQRSKNQAEQNRRNQDLEDDLEDENDDNKMRKPHPLKHRRQQRSKNHEKRNEGRQDLEDDLDDEDDKMTKPHPLKHRRQHRSKTHTEQNDRNHDLEDVDDKVRARHPLKHRRQLRSRSQGKRDELNQDSVDDLQDDDDDYQTGKVHPIKHRRQHRRELPSDDQHKKKKGKIFGWSNKTSGPHRELANDEEPDFDLKHHGKNKQDDRESKQRSKSHEKRNDRDQDLDDELDDDDEIENRQSLKYRQQRRYEWYIDDELEEKEDKFFGWSNKNSESNPKPTLVEISDVDREHHRNNEHDDHKRCQQQSSSFGRKDGKLQPTLDGSPHRSELSWEEKFDDRLFLSWDDADFVFEEMDERSPEENDDLITGPHSEIIDPEEEELILIDDTVDNAAITELELDAKQNFTEPTEPKNKTPNEIEKPAVKVNRTDNGGYEWVPFDRINGASDTDCGKGWLRADRSLRPKEKIKKHVGDSPLSGEEFDWFLEMFADRERLRHSNDDSQLTFQSNDKEMDWFLKMFEARARLRFDATKSEKNWYLKMSEARNRARSKFEGQRYWISDPPKERRHDKQRKHVDWYHAMGKGRQRLRRIAEQSKGDWFQRRMRLRHKLRRAERHDSVMGHRQE